MRRARIVATLGPASSTFEEVLALARAGMDVARLNFSHGTHEEHRALFEAVRRAAGEAGRPVAVLQDLQGPKIRVGKLAGGRYDLVPGSLVTLTVDPDDPDPGKVPCAFAGLPQALRKGDPILLADGAFRLETTEVREKEVVARVLTGGALTDHKGINLPGAALSIPALTPKDVDDLRFGVSLGVDFVALSFVRHASDLAEVRRIAGALPVIAKIEKPQAVEHLDAICRAADGIMVARGDLGVELPLQKVPTLQKHAIALANRLGKTAIVATQMLESMVDHPAPTRAEVSDVANAILDGADAVMLSEESAVGKFPERAVRTMATIIEEAERHPRTCPPHLSEPLLPDGTFAPAVARAATAAAEQLGIRTIACYTRSGETARLLAECRPRAAIVAFTPHESTYARTALSWGTRARRAEAFHSTDEMLRALSAALVEHGDARPGEAVIVCSAVPPDRASGGTSMMQMLRV